MRITATVQEDSITPYLEDFENRLYASREEIIRTIGKRFAEKAAADVAVWTGNLSQSIDDLNNWHLFDEGEFLQLDIVFTGLTEDFDDWWDEFRSASSPYGGRDYAYYQETGQDKVASPEDARQRWYVRENVEPSQRFANEYLQREIKRIMGV